MACDVQPRSPGLWPRRAGLLAFYFRNLVDMRNEMWLDNDMSQTEITKNIAAARDAYETATSRKARNAAAEELEFWTNKNAALHIATTNGWSFA